MRVQAGDHAGDGVSDEFFLIDRLDIVALDHAENCRQLLQFFQWQGGNAAPGNGLQLYRGQSAGNGTHRDPSAYLQFLTHTNTLVGLAGRGPDNTCCTCPWQES